MVFFTDASCTTRPQVINSAFERENEIFQNMKAAAGG